MAKKPAKAAAAAKDVPDAPLRAVDRIRRSARDLFYREGIRAVGVEEIVTQAGVTKPSLYRSFPSKDELAADYLRGYEAEFWARFDAAVAAHPGNPRAQILDYLTRLASRAVMSGYRGCGLTNAAIEYPDPTHPARTVSDPHKRALRKRLKAMATEMGAARPGILADGLLLLIEGTFASSQIFGPGGPGGSVAAAAEALIEASLKKTR
ncbi:TetR family transcriptional regulator [Hypericibacter terrae]|uniref:TetR family transcriptional regulator n=1 Tax=Hypericibacter terrae TaxID=2602015 RepID=A0A5J6MNC7_9PROT|nr:TetR/AcrR family transcriptional regulator [Hypericibacter terrae]QEX19108.1 TetR family transcriptional regulator [Hypericibacter terrae]